MQTNPKPELSACLSVDQRGFLRLYNLYAGPIVGIHITDLDNKEHIYATFTSTNEAPNVQR